MTITQGQEKKKKPLRTNKTCNAQLDPDNFGDKARGRHAEKMVEKRAWKKECICC